MTCDEESEEETLVLNCVKRAELDGWLDRHWTVGCLLSGSPQHLTRYALPNEIGRRDFVRGRSAYRRIKRQSQRAHSVGLVTFLQSVVCRSVQPRSSFWRVIARRKPSARRSSAPAMTGHSTLCFRTRS